MIPNKLIFVKMPQNLNSEPQFVVLVLFSVQKSQPPPLGFIVGIKKFFIQKRTENVLDAGFMLGRPGPETIKFECRIVY